MGLIWDAERGEHVIRVGGVEVDRIRAADFDAARTDAELEADLKARGESGMPPGKPWQLLVHIFDRAGKKYRIGLRHPDWVLPGEAVKAGLAWWEWPPHDDPPEEARRG
jgi:hypothetical protein